eukprot:TRINITY_DN9491_c0_g2_i2.p1 TRINITY_DN9491_c0_g2~~TRINITY_DN9491_c0_g2_i2.p1  ORF type:complete len:474 (-),score=34.68 TRINITY_DN9491_c0_g2_i2:295-1716(-)
MRKLRFCYIQKSNSWTHISRITSLREVQEFVEDYGEDLNEINLSTVFVMVARLRQPYEKIHPLDEKIALLLHPKIQQLDTQALVNCLWAMGRMNDIGTWNTTNVCYLLAQCIEGKIEQLEAQSLSMVILAFGKLWLEYEHIFNKLLQQFAACDWSQLKGQAFANVLWATSMRERKPGVQLIDNIVQRLPEVKHMTGRDVGMSLNALTKLRYHSQELIQKAIDLSIYKDYSDYDIASILTAMSQFHERNWDQLLQHVDLRKLNVQHAVIAMRALSILGADVSIAQSTLDNLQKEPDMYLMSQIFYAHQTYRCRGQKLNCPIQWLTQGRQNCLQEVYKQVRRKRNSGRGGFQSQVLDTLKKMNINFDDNYVDEELAREVGVKINLGSEKVAMVMANQKRFAYNMQQLLGSVVDNNNVLEKLGGWRVEIVPYYEFGAIKSSEERKNYLRQIIFRSNAGVPQLSNQMQIQGVNQHIQ